MSSQKTFRIARYVAAGALTVLTFGAAHAGEVSIAEDSARTTVQYSDLNLSRQADAQILYSRLQHASDRVCLQHKELRNLNRMKLYNECYQSTLARAVANVDHAMVNAAYAADERVRIASR